jgi:hypothetical protein
VRDALEASWGRKGLGSWRRACQLAAVVLLTSGSPSAAGQVTTVINNGLAPPNPDNVVDEVLGLLAVQNVGCDINVLDPCPMPWGDPTAVEVTQEATIVVKLSTWETSSVTVSSDLVGSLESHEFSTATIIGGMVGVGVFHSDVVAYDSSVLSITGGRLAVGALASDVDVVATDSSTLWMSAGEIGHDLRAEGTAEVTMSGGIVGSEPTSSGDDGNLVATQDASATLSGGTVTGWLEAIDSARITMTGGEVLGSPPRETLVFVRASGSARIDIKGGQFPGIDPLDHGIVTALDESIVTFYGGRFGREDGVLSWPEGPIPAPSPVIFAGVLESGDALIFTMSYEGDVAIASGGTDVINNGLAPPNPANVIADPIETHTVFVQNVGCDATLETPCPMPWGEPTDVTLVDGGEIGGFDLVVFESSGAHVSGGTIWGDLVARDVAVVELSGGEVLGEVYARDGAFVEISGGAVGIEEPLADYRANDVIAEGSSVLTIRGGAIQGDVHARGNAAVTLTGGALEGGLSASDTATVSILGQDFEVDGSPIGEGPIEATSGSLTGTLASGTPLTVTFERDQGATITVPEPNPGLLALAAVLALAVLRSSKHPAARTRGLVV